MAALSLAMHAARRRRWSNSPRINQTLAGGGLEETNLTIEYIEKERKKSIVKMAAARTLWDSATTKTARNAAYDDYLFWQDKLAFFECALRAKAVRS